MEIQTIVLLDTFVMSEVPEYWGISDLIEHAELYHDKMLIKGVDNKAMCRVFPHALIRPVKSWLRSLKAYSVSSID